MEDAFGKGLKAHAETLTEFMSRGYVLGLA